MANFAAVSLPLRMSDLIRSAPDAVRAEGLPDGVLKFVLCRSGEVDAHTSIIEPGGVSLERHRTNPVFLWQHQSGTNAIGAAPGPEVVIGKVTEYQQDDKELVITVLFDLEDDLAATCYRKCKQGFLNGVSIGCRVDADAARIEKIDGIEVTIYPKSTLLEASLVILPSLGSALRVDRAAAATMLRSLGSEGAVSASDTVAERAVPAAYADIDFSISDGVRKELNKALDWIEEGLGGDGLTSGAKSDARRLLSGGKWWPEKARKAHAFFARHGAQSGPMEADGKPTPKRVAWALWGGDAGESQTAKLSRQMDAADKGERGIAGEPDVIVRADPTPSVIPSAMLALYPSLEVARSIAVPDGYAPEDLHLTLACFGTLPEGAAERLEIVASSWAKSHTPLEGEVSGCGRFYRNDGDVFYATPDLPKMEVVRDGVLNDLKWGAPSLIPTDGHGYTPHITLSKIADGDTSPKAPPRIPLHFDAISVVIGDVRKDFNFVTPDTVVVDGATVVESAANPLVAPLEPNPFLASLGSKATPDPSLPPPIAAIAQKEASGSVLEGVSQDAQRAATATAASSLPYTRDIVQPGLTPGENIAYTAKVVKMKTSREYRGMIRGLMNLEMDGAEMHGYLAEMDGVQDEMRASHREAMKCGLKRAEDMVRLIAIDLDDDEGEGMERLVPGLKDAEMRALFAGTAQKVGKLPLTLRQVVKDRFGTEDPITVETRAMAWQGSQERLKKLTDEKRALANAAQSEERERLIAQYLDPKVALITPAEAQEMRGLNPATGEPSGKPAWSPERVHTLIRERGGAPIVEIARIAPLATVAGAAAVVPGAQPLVQREGVAGAGQPAQPAVLTRGQELAAGIRVNTTMAARDNSQVEAHIAEGAAALGISTDALREHMARKAAK